MYRGLSQYIDDQQKTLSNTALFLWSILLSFPLLLAAVKVIDSIHFDLSGRNISVHDEPTTISIIFKEKSSVESKKSIKTKKITVTSHKAPSQAKHKKLVKNEEKSTVGESLRTLDRPISTTPIDEKANPNQVLIIDNINAKDMFKSHQDSYSGPDHGDTIIFDPETRGKLQRTHSPQAFTRDKEVYTYTNSNSNSNSNSNGNEIAVVGEQCFTLTENAETGVVTWSLPKRCSFVKTESEKLIESMVK